MASDGLTIPEAAELLRQGEVIAYPTEAVYGLGCDPLNPEAVQRLLEIKSRPVAAGLILIADNFLRLQEYVAIDEQSMPAAVKESWPGPVTWLFPKSALVPRWISGDHDSVAVRVTAHTVCRELCASFGGPIVSTSANRSGEEPARNREAVIASLGAAIAGVVEGTIGEQQNPSEIRDVQTGDVIRPA